MDISRNYVREEFVRMSDCLLSLHTYGDMQGNDVEGTSALECWLWILTCLVWMMTCLPVCPCGVSFDDSTLLFFVTKTE